LVKTKQNHAVEFQKWETKY